MEAHGENYKGPVPGLFTCPIGHNYTTSKLEGYTLQPPVSRPGAGDGTNLNCKKRIVKPTGSAATEEDWENYNHHAPVCPDALRVYKTYDEDIKKRIGAPRVGGVVITSKTYGPGVYNALCYIPKTADKEKDGRGYVFAMWPFHYSEFYSDAARKSWPRPTKTSGFERKTAHNTET